MRRRWRAHSSESDESATCLAVRARGASFLRQQVRRLVAVLLEAGRGRLGVEGAKELLASREPARCPRPVAAHGLYLASVRYPPGAFTGEEVHVDVDEGGLSEGSEQEGDGEEGGEACIA